MPPLVTLSASFQGHSGRYSVVTMGRFLRRQGTLTAPECKRPVSQPKVNEVMLYPNGMSSTSQRQPHVLSGRRDRNLGANAE